MGEPSLYGGGISVGFAFISWRNNGYLLSAQQGCVSDLPALSVSIHTTNRTIM